MSPTLTSTTPVTSADVDRRAAIAHVLRRTRFGVTPELVERFADASDAIEFVIADDRAYALDPDEAGELPIGENEWEWLPAHFMERLVDPDAGLHERMVWFWHGHFTSSSEEAPARAMVMQHHLIRRHALGNFRELCHEITVDPAMLLYLDGAGSRGDEPNENYARELMELFALGIGNYTEDDVRVAARGLSGWWVHWETLEVGFDAEDHYEGPLSLFGDRKRWDTRSVIDAVCDHPACARHVADRLWRYFIGPEPSGEALDELADTFRDADLEIRPLVEAILRRPEFVSSVGSKARQPVEWMVAAIQATGQTLESVETWRLDAMGQLPFSPPNVAGWPDDERWAGASQQLSRLEQLLEWEIPDELEDQLVPEVDAVLTHCGIYDPCESTRAALERIEREVAEYDGRLNLLLILALSSPEFALT